MSCSRWKYYISNILLHFKVTMPQMRLLSKIVAKFALSNLFVDYTGRCAKCLSRFFEFSSGPNLLHALDRASLGRLGDYGVRAQNRSKEKTMAKHKGQHT